MQYISHYQSPVGAILIAADDIGLTGLWFEGQKYFALHLDAEHEEKEIPLFGTVKRWLDIYFSGKELTRPIYDSMESLSYKEGCLLVSQEGKYGVININGKEMVEAEIQIRTLAMDFWASLDHKIQYKFQGSVPKQVQDNMYKCAIDINDLDHKMLILNYKMRTFREDNEVI